MLTKTITFVQTAIAKYKAHRVNAVVHAFFLGSQVNAVTMLGAYSAAAQHIVNKTDQDARPLINLLSALQQCVEHYGPGLSEIVEGALNKLDRDGEDIKIALNGTVGGHAVRHQGVSHA